MFHSNLLKYNLKIELNNSKKYFFDKIRKKKVMLTPEEWVRQSIIMHLTSKLNYPEGLISLESLLKYNKLTKRSDILVKSRNGIENYLLVECKSFKIKLNESHLSQVSIYNNVYSSKYVMITNGIDHFVISIKDESGDIKVLDKIPEYEN
ncbi:MAG: type I restriction enzyme HsdR N-terminal domain-containing protein [Flammeovirgaceae bacterium TMED290]|nr:MAG: type I restriction enzyme HsdR N-terminal domain-containing protein [Flammeovirgaceae bacterium TMED290]|tara:strand:- start:4080 stop:4529 length:450 start_codon:yes stop_codon:yes gene_type:complete